jgi:hypothetical protein
MFELLTTIATLTAIIAAVRCVRAENRERETFAELHTLSRMQEELLSERDEAIAYTEALIAEADSAGQALRIQSQRVEALESYSAEGKELLRYAAKQLGTSVSSLAQQYDSAHRKGRTFSLDADGFEI